MMKRFIYLFLVAITLFSYKATSQEVGVEMIVNPQAENLGAGIRLQMPISYFIVSVQGSYFPTFNKVWEYYIGAGAQLSLITVLRTRLYILGHISYNSWVNHDRFSLDKAKQNNISYELGAGFKLRRCIAPFGEFRYNFAWKETNYRIGVVFNLACKKPFQKGAMNKKYKPMQTIMCPFP